MLNGVPAPRLSHELEEKLKAMFAEIQEPFEKNCPANRKNFLSYGYTLYKFCELLGEGKGLHGLISQLWLLWRLFSPPAVWPHGHVFVRRSSPPIDVCETPAHKSNPC